MNLLFLGTAAAEGYPGAFCECHNCIKAKRQGGRSLRKRSAILVNSDLLIDLPPDLYCSAISYSVSLSCLRSILVTHSHSDHFSPQLLEFRKRSFAFTPLPKLALLCDKALFPLVEGAVKRMGEARLRLRSVSPYKQYKVAKYRVTPIPANHVTSIEEETALNYILQHDGKTVLYACDTGPYSKEALKFLLKKRFDTIVVECTMGEQSYGFHMNYDSVIALHEWAEDNDVLKKGARFIVTHIAHDGCGTHSEVRSFLRPHGIAVAYDGLQLLV